MATPILNSTLPPNPTASSIKVQIYDLLFTVVGAIIVGTAGFVCNVFILVIIGKNKSLQSPCFLLICLECVCSIILAIGHFGMGVHQAIQIDPVRIPIRPRWLCYMSTTMPNVFAIQAQNLAVCCVALDRLISLISPTQYQVAGGRYVRWCWAFCLVYTIGTTIIWGTLSEPSGLNNLIKCDVQAPFRLLTPTFLAYRSPFNLIIGVFALVLYTAMLIAFKLRVGAIKDPRAAQAFLKHQQACLPTVKLLMIFYALTAIVPDLFLNIATFSSGVAPYIPRTASYVGPLKGAATLAQITALYFGSSKFRECAKAALGYGQARNAVGPAPGSSGRKAQTWAERQARRERN